jgi:hypothetical protein
MAEVAVEQDRIDLTSPLTGLRVERASPLGRVIEAASAYATQLAVASAAGVTLVVASGLSLEVLE